MKPNLLATIWDDVVAGPTPDDHGLAKFKKPLSVSVKGEGDQAAGASSDGGGKVFNRSLSMPASPATPVTPKTPVTVAAAAARNNVWRSVFHPGSNLATKGLGGALFDKPESPNSPTVYDWLYSGDTRSKHQ